MLSVYNFPLHYTNPHKLDDMNISTPKWCHGKELMILVFMLIEWFYSFDSTLHILSLFDLCNHFWGKYSWHYYVFGIKYETYNQVLYLIHIQISTRSPVYYVDKEVFCSTCVKILIIQ